jgi:hypothetical protein
MPYVVSFDKAELPLEGYSRTVASLRRSTFNAKLWIISELPQAFVSWDDVLITVIQKLTSAKRVKEKGSTIKCYFSATTIPQPPVGQDQIDICIAHQLDGACYPAHVLILSHDADRMVLNACSSRHEEAAQSGHY